MKKLTIFFCLHLFIILTLSIYLFIDAAWKTNENVPVLSFLKKEIYDSNVIRPYLVFSGINTGYGFYGINVATNKFFLIEVLDKENCIVQKINVSDFQSKNSFQRFHTLPSWLYNFKVETKDLKEKADSPDKKKYVDLRDQYVQKINKHILRSYIAPDEVHKEYQYIIKLVTVVPPDIWNSKLEKNNIYVLEDYVFQSGDLYK